EPAPEERRDDAVRDVACEPLLPRRPVEQAPQSRAALAAVRAERQEPRDDRFPGRLVEQDAGLHAAFRRRALVDEQRREAEVLAAPPTIERVVVAARTPEADAE